MPNDGFAGVCRFIRPPDGWRFFIRSRRMKETRETAPEKGLGPMRARGVLRRTSDPSVLLVFELKTGCCRRHTRYKRRYFQIQRLRVVVCNDPVKMEDRRIRSLLGDASVADGLSSCGARWFGSSNAPRIRRGQRAAAWVLRPRETIRPAHPLAFWEAVRTVVKSGFMGRNTVSETDFPGCAGHAGSRGAVVVRSRDDRCTAQMRD